MIPKEWIPDQASGSLGQMRYEGFDLTDLLFAYFIFNLVMHVSDVTAGERKAFCYFIEKEANKVIEVFPR